MARFKKFSQKKKEGRIVYKNGIVDGIVMLAVSQIPMAQLFTYPNSTNTKSSSVKVTYDKEGVNVDIAVKIHFSQSISDMAFKIQEAVRHDVESMTEYHIASVNVIVKSVYFDDNTEEKIEDKPTENIVEDDKTCVQEASSNNSNDNKN